MYIDGDTVLRVLRRIGGLAVGTGVVFDYVITPDLLGPVERLVFDEFAKRVAAAGEPWIGRFDPAQLGGELTASGFTQVEDLGPDDINTRFFADRTDGMRAGALARIVRARV
jgi:O-methyltransferase involved in polyketide biosynthesis